MIRVTVVKDYTVRNGVLFVMGLILGIRIGLWVLGAG
jgi:hypothetical protein